LSQLSFPFQTTSTPYREEDFLLLAENSSAVNFLKKFFAQENFSKSQFPSVILKAAPFAGKTHLLHIFAKKFSAEFLEKEKISNVNPADFFSENKFYILEDVNEIADEELLLRLINSAFESGAFLILSANSLAQFRLKDLTSRLKNIFTVEIKNPSQESIKQLLVNGFARRQIKVSRQVTDLISDRIDRSYEAVFAAVKKVEAHCQEGGRSLSALFPPCHPRAGGDPES
jgi:chromosomal replication initiation ATPase DnaA